MHGGSSRGREERGHRGNVVLCKQHCPPDYSGSSEPAAQLEELNVCPASKVAPGSTRTALPTAPACKKDDEIRKMIR